MAIGLAVRGEAVMVGRALVRVIVLLSASLALACGVEADSVSGGALKRSSANLLGTETAVDPTVYPIAQPNDDIAPKAVFDGTNYFVVWIGDGNTGIYGVRLSKSGMPLDPVSILIGQQWAGATSIDVTTNGTEYLVVWADPGNHVQCARVSTAGEVLDPKPVLVGGEMAFDPAVASDGDGFAVVWSETVSGAGILKGARVASNGGVLDPGGVAIGPAGLHGADPEIGFDGTSYMVVFNNSSDTPPEIYGLRVAPDLSAIGPPFLISSALAQDEQQPDLSFSPALGTYLVVWQSAGVVYGRRVSHDGQPLGTGESKISPNGGVGWPQVAVGGSGGWTVTWDGNPDLYQARVDANGAVIGAPQVKVTSGHVGMPSIATSDAGSLVVWDEASESLDIFAKRMSLEGTVLDSQPRLISKTNNHQQAPAADFDGVNNVVAWVDDRNSGDIHAALVGGEGEVLDPSPIVITNTSDSDSSPDIAFNGTDHLVVWTRTSAGNGQVLAARLTPAGVVKDPAGILISATAAQGAPTVTSLGSDFLIAWSSEVGGNLDVVGKRVAADGAVLDPAPIGIATGPIQQLQPSSSSDGNNYFVVWAEELGNARGARISATGTVLDPNGLDLGAHPVLSEKDLDVAFDGKEYMVVWTVSPLYTIAGSRISTDGTIITPRFGLAGEESRSPAIAYDGYGFFTAWEYSFHGDPFDLMGTRHSLPLSLTWDDLSNTSVALAQRGPGRVLLAWQKWLRGSTLRGPRVFFKTFEIGGPGAACVAAGECSSGICVDGVCCVTECSGNCATCAKGTGACAPADKGCAGNCSRCADTLDGFSCVGDETRCPGECSACTGSEMSFSCVSTCAEAGLPEASLLDQALDRADADVSSDAAPEETATGEKDATLAETNPSQDSPSEPETEGAAGESGSPPDTPVPNQGPGEQGCACSSSGKLPGSAAYAAALCLSLLTRRRRGLVRPVL